MTSINDAYVAFRASFAPEYTGDPGPGPITTLKVGAELIEAIANNEDSGQSEAIRAAQIQAVGAMVGGYVSRFVKLAPDAQIRVMGIHVPFHPPYPSEIAVRILPPEQPDQDGEPTTT